MNIKEALDEFDKIRLKNKIGLKNNRVYDNEVIHEEADKVLLEMVPEEVKKAYLELEDDVGVFWYA